LRFIRLSLLLLVLVVLAALAAVGVPAASAQSCSTTMSTNACDAYQGVQEFIGSSDNSPVAWSYSTGLWGNRTGPYWWQSALGINTLARYGQRTGQLQSSIQAVLTRTYQVNDQNSFTNNYMDDTAWWGSGWLTAAQYELYVLNDKTDARNFLSVAENDADYIAKQQKVCGGIPWSVSPQTAPHTISQSTYIALAAGLARFLQASGPLQNTRRASTYLRNAQNAWNWLASSGLVDTSTGKVTYDSIASTSNCQSFGGGPVTYTQGEVADALVQLGTAAGNAVYYGDAASFLNWAINPDSPAFSPFVCDSSNDSSSSSVPSCTEDFLMLQDRCEIYSINCSANSNEADVTAFKGIFMQGMSDYVSATASTAFDTFIQDQPTAIIENDDFYGYSAGPTCGSPTSCQFGRSWARVEPLELTDGTQESALNALTAALPITG
jgi:Glycosyl hydrolase family 76